MADKRKGPPISIDAARCTGCLLCELRCSLRFVEAFSPAKAAIAVMRQVDSPREYQVSFNDNCDNCGLCVQFCSYGALTQT